MNSEPNHSEFAARVIGALGQLMLDFHARDLAVQSAVSELTTSPNVNGLNMTDLQHIDLVTQTHADLARFLPRLAESIRADALEEQTLSGTLTLRSLQDVLLRPFHPEDPDGKKARSEPEIDPGEMDLF